MEPSTTAAPRELAFHRFLMSERPRRLTFAGRPVHLTPQQFRLLWLLALGRGQAVSRDQIRLALWGENTHVDFERNITVTVQQIRKALAQLAPDRLFIETLPGVGYRMAAPVAAVSEAGTFELGVRRLVGACAVLFTVVAFGGFSGWYLSVEGPVRSAFGVDALPSRFPVGPSPSVDQLEAFARAQSLLRSREPLKRKAGEEMLHGLALDDFGPAHLARARASFEKRWEAVPLREVFQTVAPAARRALQHAESAEAYHFLAYEQLRVELDPPAACDLLRRALTLDPERPESWHLLGLALLATGDAESASDHLRFALEQSPHQVHWWADLAYARWIAGDLEGTLRFVHRSGKVGERLFPTSLEISARLALGDREGALATARRLVAKLMPGEAPPLTLEAWRGSLARYLETLEKSGYAWGSEVALVYAQQGRLALAQDRLQRACDERSGWSLPYLAVDPRFAGLMRAARQRPCGSPTRPPGLPVLVAAKSPWPSSP